MMVEEEKNTNGNADINDATFMCLKREAIVPGKWRI